MPITSIIIPCHNQVELTRRCLAAIAEYTPESYELILVDNGSTDESAELFTRLTGSTSPPTRVVSNSTNLGFPKAINQGLKVSQGDFVVLLNNDVVVTEGWLTRLIRLTQVGPKAGLVGPMSNYVSAHQLIEHVSYADLNIMHKFAAKWKADHRGRWFATPKLSGFCLLMTRAVVDALGGLDERFGLGFYDDDDLALRAKRTGFELVVAEDQFVHHDGSKTFQSLGIDIDALMVANQAKFLARWSGLVRLGPGGSMAFDLPKPRKVKVTLTMIVRDDSANLAACIASARPLFDELVVVDTGSGDNTVALAHELGAKVIETTWDDDFAKARNLALDHATGDMILWLDADDRVEPDQVTKFLDLISSLNAPDRAFSIDCICPRGSVDEVIGSVRLFPRRAEIRWELRVHETILRSCIVANVPVTYLPLRFKHIGYLAQDKFAGKISRTSKLLDLELNDRPDDPLVRLNLGFHAAQVKDWEGALDHLRDAVLLARDQDRMLRFLYGRLANDLWVEILKLYSPEAGLGAGK